MSRSRCSTEGNIEGKYEPGIRVLKNKLGIRSKGEMDRLEYEHLLRTQKHYYQVTQPDTIFTNHIICEMHRHWLGSLYEWAGRYRTVNLAKTNFVWPPANLVTRNMDEFEKTFLREFTPCKHGHLDKVAEDIAKVQAELLLVHPFREGNGKIARLVSNLMALQTGYPALDFAFHKKENRRIYLAAVKQGYLQNYESLTRLVKEAIQRSQTLLAD